MPTRWLCWKKACAQMGVIDSSVWYYHPQSWVS
nr:MAG TPA: hypothetical protein [Caudoviricetes sp.]